MSLSGTSSYFKDHLNLLEKYWLAQDKQKFVETIPNLNDKKILKLLIQKLPENYEEIFQQLKIPSNVRQELLESKLLSGIKNAVNEEQRSKWIGKYVEEYFKYLNFEYPKPIQNTSFTTETVENSLNLENSKLQLPQNVSIYLQKLIEKEFKNFQSLDGYGIKHLEQSFLLKLDQNNKKNLIDRFDLFKTFSDQFVAKFLLSYVEEEASRRKNKFYQNIHSYNLNKLGQSQINKLKELKPQIMSNSQFCKKWFKVNYQNQIQINNKIKRKPTLKELNERRETLLKIKEQLSKENVHLVKEYQNHLFYEILLLDLQRQDPDKNLFYQFLSNQQGISSFFNKNFRDQITQKYGRKSLTQYNTIDSNQLLSCSFTIEKMITSYIDKLFKKYKNPEQITTQLSKYLDFTIVSNIYVKVKLSQGQEVPNLNEILQKYQIEEIKKSKEITIIAEKTQKFFNPQDQVVLTIRTKNIKQMKLKIYEINMEQFYLQNQNANIDETINLMYLNPTYEEIIEIKNFKNSFQVIEQELSVGQIPKGCGIFIVELVGQGLTTRAVIKKGGINCFEQNHIDGKLLKFYDEQGNIIENMRIWINGRNEILKNGQYVIPFSKKNQSVKVLAIRDNFVEKFDIYLSPQQYNFDLALIYNHESFVVGKKSKFILHPVLKLGNSKVSVENMQNVKVSANLINNQNIKSTQKFDNVKFSDQKDFVLEVPIKSYTKSIEIVVQGEVKDLEGKIIELTCRKNIAIQLMEGTQNYIDIYLNRANKGKSNILKLRGLNGQTIPNLDVTLTLTFYGTSKTQDKILKTNKNGQIDLGELNYVQKVKSSINTTYGVISRTWNLKQIVDEVSYFDKNLVYHQNDSIKIPLPSEPHFTQENLHYLINFERFQDQNNKSIYENKLSSVKVISEESFSFLTFGALQPGLYDLKFLMIDKTITIRIVAGKKWPDGKILDQNSGQIYKIVQIPLIFTNIGDLKEEKGQKQGTNKIIIPLNIPQEAKEDLQSVRVHVFLKNNFDSSDNNIETHFYSLQNFSHHPQFSYQNLKQQESTFYSNKPLSDEQAYVINRQNEKQFIGNNLQKPKIFLKRIQVRDTTQKDEVLAKQGSYDKNFDAYDRKMRECYAQKCAPYRGNGYYDASGGFVLLNYDLNSHNNFLALSGHSLLNIKFNKNLSITIPQGYSSAIVYLITEKSAVKRQFFFETPSIQLKKDIKHLGLSQKNQGSGWSMSRQIYHLQKKDKKQISRDSIFCTVTLSNILQYAQIKGHKLPQWLSQWSFYSEAKKLQVYDKQVCHELNVYINRQDPQFFKRVVEPFIRNKLTKTFVDLCLLGDNEVISFSHPHKIKELNEFEKVLLIQSLVQKGKKQIAHEIALSMQLTQKPIKRSFETYKELFDIVLNSEDNSSKKQKKMLNFSVGGAANVMFGMPASDPFNLCSTNSVRMAQNHCVEMEIAMDDQSEERMIQQQKCQSRQMHKKMARKRSIGSKTLKKDFKEVQKTKQYTEVTYAGIKSPKMSLNLVTGGPFWADLAKYLSKGDNSKDFLSEGFLYFNCPIEFTLACCFLSNVSHADYQLSNQEDNYVIEANNSFMLFVKQVKELNYTDKFGVLINQRFFNPEERFTYEDDGTQIQKLVDQFVVKKPYILQTVVTNTSGTNLELQLLMDIPSGAIPLMSHQNVQINNVTINSFSTTSFERYFYFPSEGKSVLYPANASRNNVVIAKAKRLPQFQVKKTLTINKLQSLNDIMRSGSKKEILDYLEKRNIFDFNIFSSYSIFWMLKDKQFFLDVVRILRKRNYFDPNIWSFGVLHKDMDSIYEYIASIRQNNLEAVQIPIFQYFPYFSRRAHKFMDETKSTIRNVQFKETYENFLIFSLLTGKTSSIEKVTFAYYLLLQDRIDECSAVFKSLTEEERKSHEIQTDYLACYLSMYQDYPNFTTAQTISEKYQNYPVSTWNKMFKEIFDTLKQYREDIEEQQQSVTKKTSEFRTTYIQEAQQLKISVPSNTRVQAYFYDINLQLYFSDFPFNQIQSLSAVKQKVSKVYPAGESREQRLLYSEVQNLGNMIVQIYQFKEGTPALKIGSFFWGNPKLKVKISQNQGMLQVFYDGKRQPGCYIKVYSTGSKGVKFYRDGYTDITGKFRYVLADLQGLTKFSILAITPQGGLITSAGLPSTIGHF